MTSTKRLSVNWRFEKSDIGKLTSTFCRSEFWLSKNCRSTVFCKFILQEIHVLRKSVLASLLAGFGARPSSRAGDNASHRHVPLETFALPTVPAYLCTNHLYNRFFHGDRYVWSKSKLLTPTEIWSLNKYSFRRSDVPFNLLLNTKNSRHECEWEGEMDFTCKPERSSCQFDSIFVW